MQQQNYQDQLYIYLPHARGRALAVRHGRNDGCYDNDAAETCDKYLSHGAFVFSNGAYIIAKRLTTNPFEVEDDRSCLGQFF